MGFDPEEIKTQIENLVKFSLNIFKDIIKEETLKSTPHKPHYLFSIREINRFSKGIGLINKLNCD